MEMLWCVRERGREEGSQPREGEIKREARRGSKVKKRDWGEGEEDGMKKE